jgi:hypothetical protein
MPRPEILRSLRSLRMTRILLRALRMTTIDAGDAIQGAFMSSPP